MDTSTQTDEANMEVEKCEWQRSRLRLALLLVIAFTACAAPAKDATKIGRWGRKKTQTEPIVPEPQACDYYVWDVVSAVKYKLCRVRLQQTSL